MEVDGSTLTAHHLSILFKGVVVLFALDSFEYHVLFYIIDFVIIWFQFHISSILFVFVIFLPVESELWFAIEFRVRPDRMLVQSCYCSLRSLSASSILVVLFRLIKGCWQQLRDRLIERALWGRSPWLVIDVPFIVLLLQLLDKWVQMRGALLGWLFRDSLKLFFLLLALSWGRL